MTLTEEQVLKFLEAAKPLIKWLNENCNPYCSVIVDTASAELREARDQANSRQCWHRAKF